jgi:hypothetical protein
MQSFPVHEAVLEQTPLIASACAESFRLTGNRRLRLLREDTDSLQEGQEKIRVITHLLDFLYGGTVNFNTDAFDCFDCFVNEFMRTYLTARRYQIEALQDFILQTLVDKRFYDCYRENIFEMVIMFKKLYDFTNGQDPLVREYVIDALTFISSRVAEKDFRILRCYALKGNREFREDITKVFGPVEQVFAITPVSLGATLE